MISQAQPFFQKYAASYEEYLSAEQVDFCLFRFGIAEDGLPQVRAIPDGYVDIFIDLGKHTASAAKIYGFIKHSQNVDFLPGHHYFGLRLQPIYAMNFLRMPLKELCEQVVDLSLVAKDRLAILDQLLVENDLFMQASCLRRSGPDTDQLCLPVVRWLMSEIKKQHGKVKIAQLAEASGYSAVYLRRLFKEQLGLSCKNYSDIVRFQSAIRALKAPDCDIFAVIEGLGFYDQAHFINQLKRFSGCTPTELQQKIAGC